MNVSRQIALHFENGTEKRLDESYCKVDFFIGEKIIVEGGDQFLITDIQHQVRKDGPFLKMIMINVMLEKIHAGK